jgi:hypothetical protein
VLYLSYEQLSVHPWSAHGGAGIPNRPVVFRSNGEILMAGYANSQLVSCDPQTQEIHDMGLEVLLDDYADYFVESLALLDRSN